WPPPSFVTLPISLFFAKALPECDLRNFSSSNLATLGKGGLNQYLHSASRPIPLTTGSSSVSRSAQSIMACQPALMAPGSMAQASSISWVGSRIAAMAAWARANAAVSSNGAVPISCWSACATRLTMVLIDLYPHEVSAAMEGSARFVVVLLLRHLAAAEFSENRNRLFAVIVEPINTYAVVGVGVFRDLEH